MQLHAEDLGHAVCCGQGQKIVVPTVFVNQTDEVRGHIQQKSHGFAGQTKFLTEITEVSEQKIIG